MHTGFVDLARAGPGRLGAENWETVVLALTSSLALQRLVAARRRARPT